MNENAERRTEEARLRSNWEVLVAVGERFCWLVDEMAIAMPDAQRKQAQRLAEHIKDHLVAYQDEAIDILEAAGIDYSVL